LGYILEENQEYIGDEKSYSEINFLIPVFIEYVPDYFTVDLTNVFSTLVYSRIRRIIGLPIPHKLHLPKAIE